MERYFNQIKLLIFHDFRDNYPSWFSFLSQIIGVLIGLCVYWYTGAAFVPEGESYFSYVVIGQLVLFIPMTMLAQLSIAIQKAMGDGTFEIFLTSPGYPQRHFLILGLAMIPRELCWMLLFFVIALVGFDFQVSLFSLLFGVAIQMIALPAFAGLGLIAASFVIYLGKGSGAASTIGSLLTVFSGAYFPLSVLHSGVQKILANANPLVPLVSVERLVFDGPLDIQAIAGQMLVLSLHGAVYFVVGWLACSRALRLRRKRGSGILI